MASVFTDPISGNTQITGSVTVDNISIRGLALGATTLSSNAIWLPSTTVQWNQVFSPDLPTFTLPDRGVMSYARQKGLYRWTGNDLVYTINVAGTLTSATTTNLGDFTLNVPYPINTGTYSSSTIIGELWLSSVYQNTSNIYKAYAKTIPATANSVAIRVLTGTADETMSTILADTELTLQGTMTYNTTSFNQTGGVPATYVPAMFYQDTAGQVSMNSNLPPRARLDIYENSNTPALIVDQYGSGDALQVRIGGETKLRVDAQGNLDLPGGIFLAPVSGAPHVAFDGSAANSNVFLTWLQRTTTTLAGSWWQEAVVPRYSTISAGSGSSSAYFGGVLLPDGRVVFVPFNATTIGIFNPAINTYSTISGAPGSLAYYSGVLLPDGRVVFVPYNAPTVGFFNPVTNSYSTVTMSPAPAGGAYRGGVLISDGRVVFVPHNATTVGIFNPATNTYSTILGAPGNSAYNGGVLLPDGRVVFVPSSATTIGIFNPITDSFSTITNYIRPTINAYGSGVLIPDGRVVFVPNNATTIGIFNPTTNVYSELINNIGSGSTSYEGGSLLPDGRVVFVPRSVTTIGIFNPVTNTYSTILGAPGASAYVGGLLLYDGRVIFIPNTASTIGILSGFSVPPRELCYHPCFNKY